VSNFAAFALFMLALACVAIERMHWAWLFAFTAFLADWSH
jgi:hypothetical protein